jgi:hypothetical protein
MVAAALPAILGGIASAGTSYGLSQLTGGGSQGDYRTANTFTGPVGINAGGLTSSFSGNNLSVMPTAERLALISNIQNQLNAQAGEVGGLRGMVAPGMSALRAARIAELEGARERAIGTLRENMARRSVLGSSFGQDALARAEAEFGGAKGKVAAESLMQELELTNNLINQQFGLQRQAFQTGLDDLNLQAGIAAQLSAKGTETMQKQSQFMMEQAMKEQILKGQFFGQTLIQPLSKGVGDAAAAGAKSYFGPSGTASTPSGYGQLGDVTYPIF